jgi:hypothetical protein
VPVCRAVCWLRPFGFLVGGRGGCECPLFCFEGAARLGLFLVCVAPLAWSPVFLGGGVLVSACVVLLLLVVVVVGCLRFA